MKSACFDQLRRLFCVRRGLRLLSVVGGNGDKVLDFWSTVTELVQDPGQWRHGLVIGVGHSRER